MVRYLCRFGYGDVLRSDPQGFDAADDQEAAEVARAIASVLLHKQLAKGEAVVTLQDEAGRLILSSSIRALVADVQ